jgi:hypothetical protein
MMLGLANKCVDRAERSKRQDRLLEAAFDIFPLLDPLLSYTVKSLLEKVMFAFQSVCAYMRMCIYYFLMQAECLHFKAYVHICTMMWWVVFKEQRGLTNSKVTYVTLLLSLTRILYLILYFTYNYRGWN